jgi:hypothetical protein
MSGFRYTFSTASVAGGRFAADLRPNHPQASKPGAGKEQMALYRARTQHQAVTCMFVLPRVRE